MQLFQRHWLYQVLSSWLLQLMQSLLLSSTTVIAKYLCVQCLVFSIIYIYMYVACHIRSYWDWPSFAGCLYLVFHSLADTYKKFQACTTRQKVRHVVNCMSGILSDLIYYMFLLLSKDWPSFADCLYLVFPSLLADTYMRKFKHAPRHIVHCNNKGLQQYFYSFCILRNSQAS